MTFWLMIMYHHTKYGYKRLSGSEDIFWTKPCTHGQNDIQTGCSSISPKLCYRAYKKKDKLGHCSFRTTGQVFVPIVLKKEFWCKEKTNDSFHSMPEVMITQIRRSLADVGSSQDIWYNILSLNASGFFIP